MGRTIVVTGGGTGIGNAIAARFAQAGQHVIITGRRHDVLDHAAADLDGDVRTACFDAADPAAVESFAGDLRSIDVLVNNAGGNAEFDRAVPDSLVALANCWRSNYESNVVTAVLMTTACLDKLASGGSIVTIGSIAADDGSGSYGPAKAAVASWNVELARTIGPRGLTANVVAPGYIADTEFFRDRLTADRRSSLEAATMTGRAGTPDDVAATVSFLASRAARQITGQVLAVNGGARTTR